MSIEFILIDDDLLIRKAWDFAAKKTGVQIESFKSVDEFLTVATQYSIDTPIYLDQELGDGLLGVNESIKLHEFGFCKIFLATGFPKSSIQIPAHILDVVGKKPPF